jgi:hypothetical protein
MNKSAFLICLLACSAALARAQGITVQRLQGDVAVRHGVTEVWTHVAVGDVLRPDDTMKTGKKGTAILVAPVKSPGTVKKIALPPEVIVDLSDVRDLTQEELMLKLTMERVRASSYQWKNDELHIPNAAVVHGENRATGAALSDNDPQSGILLWNGARVLYDNGFYSTCALKAMELFRLYPSVGAKFENHMMAAEALEKASLRGEALSEYTGMLQMEGISAAQQAMVKERIAELKKQ